MITIYFSNGKHMWLYWSMTFFPFYFVFQFKIMTNLQKHTCTTQTLRWIYWVLNVIFHNYSSVSSSHKATVSYEFKRLGILYTGHMDCFYRTVKPLVNVWEKKQRERSWKSSVFHRRKTSFRFWNDTRVSKWFLSFKCLLISSSLKLSMFIACSGS